MKIPFLQCRAVAHDLEDAFQRAKAFNEPRDVEEEGRALLPSSTAMNTLLRDAGVSEAHDLEGCPSFFLATGVSDAYDLPSPMVPKLSWSMTLNMTHPSRKNLRP